jgi:anti-anti-sigma factor
MQALIEFLPDGSNLLFTPTSYLASYGEEALADVWQDLRDRLESPGITGLIVDMREVSMTSAHCRGILVSLLKVMRERDRRWCLCNVSPDAMATLKTSQLDAILPIQPSMQEALKAVLG